VSSTVQQNYCCSHPLRRNASEPRVVASPRAKISGARPTLISRTRSRNVGAASRTRDGRRAHFFFPSIICADIFIYFCRYVDQIIMDDNSKFFGLAPGMPVGSISEPPAPLGTSTNTSGAMQNFLFGDASSSFAAQWNSLTSFNTPESTQT